MSADVETHLYLTDYRSLYVAEIGEVTDEDVRTDEGEHEHMPAYYRDYAIDFWFRLFDLRRVVTGDTLEVINELKKLRNAGYHDRPVSLYGGMVDLPLVAWSDRYGVWIPVPGGRTAPKRRVQRRREHRAAQARGSRILAGGATAPGRRPVS